MVILFILFVWIIWSYKKTILKRKGTPYLIRYTLLYCPLFTIKIHKALISDPEEPHDHPWNYISIILWGGYFEETTHMTHKYRYTNRDELVDDGIQYCRSMKWYGIGSILYRKGNQLHKLIIPPNKYSVSLILTFKKWRKWGYLVNGKWEQSKFQD